MYEIDIDPEHAMDIRDSRATDDSEACTMCGDFCALKIVRENFNIAK